MTVKDLLKKYKKYVVRNGLLSPSSADQYKKYLRQLPFGDIDVILHIKNQWITYQGKNTKGNYTSTYYERFDGLTPQPPVPDTKCSLKNHSLYQYYDAYIRGKNRTIARRTGYDYLQYIADFLDDGDIIYPLTIVDIVLGIAVKANDLLPKGTSIKALSDGISALRMLRRWLEYDKLLVQDVRLNSIWDNRRAQITKPLVHKIDGAVALARETGFNEFIQYAIEQCYFFQPLIVQDRRDYLTNIFNGTITPAELPARKTEQGVNSPNYRHNPPKAIHSNFEELDHTGKVIFRWPILKDKDNNDAPRSWIKKYTGYTVGEGADSIFQNYIISHIWGRAYDPRYFTNMWNIVLVPAWANSLLDKETTDDCSLEYILKETIKKVIIKLNGITISDHDWSNHFTTLQIPMPKVKTSKKEKHFIINIINNHDYHMSTTTPRRVVIHKVNSVGYIVKHPIVI